MFNRSALTETSKRSSTVAPSSLGLLCVLLALGGCAYGGVSAVGGKHVVITKNDALLFGAMRKVYVCQVTPKGLTNCSVDQSP